MLKLLKQRSQSNLVGISKKDDEVSMDLSPPSKIAKKSNNNLSLQLINYSSIVIATFTNSLIPFAIYKSSSINDDTSSPSLSYQCSSAVVMSEIIKLFIVIFIVFYEFEYNIPKTMEVMLFDVFQVHTFAVSGILYAISTVITIKMISEMGLLYIYYSLIFKVLFTTIIWKIIFHQKIITNKQWISIGLIIISTIFLTFEYSDSWSYFPFISSSIIYDKNNLNQILNENNIDAMIDLNDIENRRNLLKSDTSIFINYWWLFLLIESLFSSIGSVIAEQKYKTFEKNLSYFAQSSSMYLWSLVIASVLFYIANIKQASKELLLLNITYALEGFNIYTWILIIIYIFYGFSINYVLKYFNNLVRLLILSVAILFTHIYIYWIQLKNQQLIYNNLYFISYFLMICILIIIYIGYGTIIIHHKLIYTSFVLIESIYFIIYILTF